MVNVKMKTKICLPINGFRFLILSIAMKPSSALNNVNATNTTDIEVRLEDGGSPYIGRVQVRYNVNESWIPVCSRNNSRLALADNWDQKEIFVVCKQLGYHGGWYKEYGRGLVHERYVAHMQCQGDELSLVECDHYNSPYDTGIGCGNSQYAGAVCYARDYRPGYLGCFTDSHRRVLPDHPLSGPTVGYKWISSNMSVTLCIDRCFSLGLRYAGLEARDQCFCGKEGTRYDKLGRLADSHCGTSCISNIEEDCGGEYRLSIYDVKIARSSGVCSDPGAPRHGYRFDTNVSYAGFHEITPTAYTNMTSMNITTLNINITANSTEPAATLLTSGSSSLSTSSSGLTKSTSTSPSAALPTSTSSSTLSWNVTGNETVETNGTWQTNITYDYKSFVFFVCDFGYELVGVSSLQCVIGSTPDEVSWDGVVPSCYLPTTTAPTTTAIPTTPLITTTAMPTTLPTLPVLQIAKSTGGGTLIGVILGCLLLLALFIIIVALWIRHRKKDKTSPHPILTPRNGIGAEASTSTSIVPRRLDEDNGHVEADEATETYASSAVYETNETSGFEEEIDLENYPETSYAEVDENAAEGTWAEGEEADNDEGLDEDEYEYDNNENEVGYETGYENENGESVEYYEDSRTDGVNEDYGDEVELIDGESEAGNRR